jgi:hypothetical protein
VITTFNLLTVGSGGPGGVGLGQPAKSSDANNKPIPKNLNFIKSLLFLPSIL